MTLAFVLAASAVTAGAVSGMADVADEKAVSAASDETAPGGPAATDNAPTAMTNVYGRDYTLLNGKWNVIVDLYDQGRKMEVYRNRKPQKPEEFYEYSFDGGMRLNVPGEADFLGHGVAFCPHCDGPLFRGKRVAVIGGGNSGVEAAIDLAGIVSHVTLLHRHATLKADNVLKKKLASLSNVTVLTEAHTRAFEGTDGVLTGLRWADAAGAEHRLDVAGVFVQIGLTPNTAWLANAVELVGVRPIASVELYFDDPDDPGEVKTAAITHRVTIHYCDTDNKTHVYFTDATLDLSLGGRIRFAQGVGSMTQYQEYLEQGGTLTYLEWLQAVRNTMEEAPLDGKFYCRQNGRWVAVAVAALEDVSLSGTTEYQEELKVGAPFSIVFDVVASNGADVEFTLTGGTLPAGITLSGRTLAGTPTAGGSAELVFTAQATGVTLEITVSLVIVEAQTMYYGYVMSSEEVYRVTDITADMLEVQTVKSANAAALGKTSLGDAPAGAIVFVMLPKSSLLTAAKFDGISGYVEFEEDAGGITGSGANGTEITLFGATYLAYGEVRLIAGETFIKVEAL